MRIAQKIIEAFVSGRPVYRKTPSIANFNLNKNEGLLKMSEKAIQELSASNAVKKHSASIFSKLNARRYYEPRHFSSHRFMQNQSKIMPWVALGTVVAAAVAAAWVTSDSWGPKLAKFLGINKNSSNDTPREVVPASSKPKTEKQEPVKQPEKAEQVKKPEKAEPVVAGSLPKAKAIVTAPEVTTQKVVHGDSMWKICNNKLTEIYGRSPSDAERGTYMEFVISTNNKFWNSDYSGVKIVPGEYLKLPEDWSPEQVEQWTQNWKNTKTARKQIRERIRKEEERIKQSENPYYMNTVDYDA